RDASHDDPLNGSVYMNENDPKYLSSPQYSHPALNSVTSSSPSMSHTPSTNSS
ncbi:Hypothetical protein FKW44_017572, partial [Caligus rogercresseyi]